jgi:hypothetical protein
MSLDQRARGFDADQLAVLEAGHAARPNVATRKALAFGYAWLGQIEAAQSLLAPHWSEDLDGEEVMLLLWLDQRLAAWERRSVLQSVEPKQPAPVHLDVDGLFEMLSEIGEHPRQLARAAAGDGSGSEVQSSSSRFKDAHYTYFRNIGYFMEQDGFFRPGQSLRSQLGLLRGHGPVLSGTPDPVSGK